MFNNLFPKPDRAYYVSIPLTYFCLATTYSVGTDILFYYLSPETPLLLISSLKTMAFVCITTLVLWMLLYSNSTSRDINELSFKKLVENLNDAVFVLQLPSRKILYANPAATRIFGYSNTELIGTISDFMLTSEKQLEEFYEEALPFLDKNMPFQGEYDLLNKQNELVPIKIIISTFEGASGERFALSVISDLSVLKSEEKRVIEHEELLQQLAKNLREVFWVVNPISNTMEYISPSHEEVLGRDISDVYTDPAKFLEIIHPDDKSAIKPHLSRLDSHIYEEQYRILMPDESIRWIREKCHPITNEQGEVYRILGIVEDITSLKKHESEVSRTLRLDSLANLTNGVAHDFNNYLLIILSNAELLQQLIEKKPENLEFLEQIIKSTKEAADLTNRLLLFSKAKNLESEYVNLSFVCESLVARLESEFFENYIIDINIPIDIWSLNVNQTSLETCLENLLKNARDAMPRGGTIKVSANNTVLTAKNIRNEESADIQPGDYVKISVADSGNGIAEDIIDVMFDPFITSKSSEDGHGLGLSIVYGLIRQSKGYIRATGTTNGTIIDFYLPRGYQL